MIQFCLCTIAVILFVIIGAVLICFIKPSRRRFDEVRGKHVVITGGSLGIGKSVALELAKRGANVTIVARNKDRLDKAVQEIRLSMINHEQQINSLQLDVCSDYRLIKHQLDEIEEKFGPIFMLFNCAGSAACGTIDDLTPGEIKGQLALNTLGSIFPTKAVLAGMKKRKSGHIVITASQAAYVGIYGYSAYCTSKFALRGFAEALAMEVDPYGIAVTIAFPPDTDTPGFAEEEKKKPRETKLISESSGLYDPDVVARAMIDDSLAKKFSSNVGMDGFMLENLCCGMSPSNSYVSLFVQFCCLGLLRLIGFGFHCSFKEIVHQCAKEKEQSAKNKNE